MDLYDEFGNYIGPELGSDEEEFSGDEGDFGRGASSSAAGALVRHHTEDEEDNEMDIATPEEQRIVLHEDKKYYPDAEEVYPGVKTVTLDEDAQDLKEPIVKPVKPRQFSALLRETPALRVDPHFLTALTQSPALLRNVAVVGQLHSGKSSLCDLLVRAALETSPAHTQAHTQGEGDGEPHGNDNSSNNSDHKKQAVETVRYSDTRLDEQERGLSIKTSLLSLPLEDLRGKHFLCNVMDTPGHVNFADEAVAAMAAADGVLLVVDAVEGVMLNTERLVKAALRMGLPITLLINKVDRLILELKLPPQDAYFKLLHTLEEVNSLIAQHSHTPTHSSSQNSSTQRTLPRRLSPELGNVCFASSLHGWCFSLASFAELYLTRHPQAPFSAQDLSKRLWGDWYINRSSNVISKKKEVAGSGAVRTFVSLVLEPLYKLYAHIVGETSSELVPLLKSLSLSLSAKELAMDPQPLLRVALSAWLGEPRGVVNMLATQLPSPKENAVRKVESEYMGRQTGTRAQAMRRCLSHSDTDTQKSVPVTAHIVKLLNTSDGEGFLALTRVYSGTLRVGDRVTLLGESFTAEDDEDRAQCTVSALSLSLGRCVIEVSEATAGNLVLVTGVDASIKKTATLCGISSHSHSHSHNDSDDEDGDEELAIFRPLSTQLSLTGCAPVLKVAIEPQIPSELPKMVEALRRLNKSYLALQTKVEESGEHVVLGTGELFLDCVLHDLRHLYSDIEIKVSDPVVVFCETVLDSSAVNCIAETPNKKNTLTMLAEPLDEGLSVRIESLAAPVPMPQNAAQSKAVSDFFTKEMHWDALSARNVWAFGPDTHSPNVLVNHTLPSTVSPSLLQTVRESVIQGFKWGTREGPLCDEAMRNVKFRLLDVSLSAQAIHRGGGQVIPTVRRSIYSSFLLASPRLMEPVCLVEMQSPADCVQAIYPVLARRRGHVVQDAPKPGAPFYTVKAFLPLIDSFGFETDLRSYTMGQVFCQQVFDHWAVVPGDPLDKNVILHPLEPSPPLALARDFMVKTRRRKGLSEDVSVNKYLDDAMLLQLAKHEADLGALV